MTPIGLGFLLLAVAVLLAAQKGAYGSPFGPQRMEGFGSVGNPYNSAEPSTYQAHRFRLGQQRITDAVESGWR